LDKLEVCPRPGETQRGLYGKLVVHKDVNWGWLADSTIGELALDESKGLGEGPKLLLIICGVRSVFGEKQVLREGGAPGEQVETRPTWARVPKGRAIREGNEGLTGDLRKFFEELFFLCAFISFFPPFFVEDGLIESEEVVGYSPTCPSRGGG
jgi:hypothetical protein